MAPPVTPKKAAKRRSKDVDDIESQWRNARTLLKPKDQVQLDENELDEIIARVLQTINMQGPKGIVQFDYASGEFKPIPPPPNLIVVYKYRGTYIHKHSEEAIKQMIAMGIDPATLEEEEVEDEAEIEPEFIEEEKPTAEEEIPEEGEGEEVEGEQIEGEETEKAAEEEEQGGDDDADVEPPPTTGKPKKLTNMFNFCERAALTYNNPTRSQSTQTIPPPMATFSANVLQWIIYDAYEVDFAQQELEKELERERREREKAPVSRTKVPAKKLGGRAQLSEAVQGRVFECWRVLERMINQNTYDDIAKDFRYWEDPSDEYRDEKGTLLPLWKFSYDKTKKNTVTDICWNPWYQDLFAVCFGFLDFTKPTPNGAVCLFTLKNPSFPDYICMTDSGVMCVDIHPSYPNMVVIGLYDGSVLIYNVQASCKEPAYKSNNVLDKHNGIVWEVKWAPNLPDGDLNFYSIGADGKVNNWVLMQNHLACTTIIILYLAEDPVPGPDGTLIRKKSCPSCICFHPTNHLIYLVGTEEGKIYKCSTAYSSTYLLTYEAHHLPVYRIDYNKFNSDIFISCSADWRIKIWEDKRLEPLFVFDIGACVGDVKWAPYSSTVFAAVTTKGRVYVFDLNVHKYKAICKQAVVSKKRNKLTRIAFNQNLPIIIVGDDKGCISTLKLSPNLRIPCKAPKKQQHLDQYTLQCMKLDALLALVREPLTLTLPPDTAGMEEEY